MIGLAAIDTPHSCTAAKCGTTALGGLILVLQAGIVCQLNNKRDVCLCEGFRMPADDGRRR
jgi:hypothetical protein